MDKIHPDYYDLTVQVIRSDTTNFSFSDSLADSDFVIGNIIKYIVRHNQKNGNEDLEKASSYCDICLNQLEKYSDGSNDYAVDKIAGALHYFILDSLTEAEKNKLANHGNDLALALVLLNLAPEFGNRDDQDYRKVLIDIVSYQLSLLLDEDCAISYKDFKTVMEDAPYAVSSLILDYLEDIIELYPLLLPEIYQNSGFSYYERTLDFKG